MPRFRPERPRIEQLSTAELRQRVRDFEAYLRGLESASDGRHLYGFRQAGFGLALCDWILGAVPMHAPADMSHVRLPHPND